MDTNQIAPRKKMTATPATQPAKGRPASDTTSFGERREQILLQS